MLLLKLLLTDFMLIGVVLAISSPMKNWGKEIRGKTEDFFYTLIGIASILVVVVFPILVILIIWSKL